MLFARSKKTTDSRTGWVQGRTAMRTDAAHTWRLCELMAEARVSACAPGGGINPEIRGLAVDSRRVEAGYCFVALPGTRHDGHHFIGDAVARGASVIVAQADRGSPDASHTIRVANTHTAAARLAAAFYGVRAAQRAHRLTLAGVTGTNGKTTVCTLLRAMLVADGKQAANFGTIDNHDGRRAAAATMTTMPPIEMCAALAEACGRGSTHAVLEVSSHALDQRRCAGLDFSVGIFTNLSRDHLDYHRDMPAYARAKRRLFDGLPQSATAVVCADDAQAETMLAHCPARALRYGLEAEGCDVRARHLAVDDAHTRFVLVLPDDEVAVATPLVGRHNVANILGAAGAAWSLGISTEAIAEGVASVVEVPGRMQAVSGGPFRVFVDYAHTPDALVNVLRIAGGLTRGRVICVFGCGGDRDRGKRPAMAQAVAAGADLAIVTSDNPRGEDPRSIIDDTLAGFSPSARRAALVEPDRAAAIAKAIALAEPEDTVLIAGKGHERVQVVGGRSIPFDDVEHARSALAARGVDPVADGAALKGPAQRRAM
jgi:UDP-N-acetylmuramoyl-L-alanyl-D-glutamate--2,6-diaminopimelate ligase